MEKHFSSSAVCRHWVFAGVSAGIDMTLFFIEQVWGAEEAQKAAKYAEYNGQWADPSDDPWSQDGIAQ